MRENKYTYRITYTIDGQSHTYVTYSKLRIVKQYIEFITDTNFNGSDLKVFRNMIEITPQINKFLLR